MDDLATVCKLAKGWDRQRPHSVERILDLGPTCSSALTSYLGLPRAV
jgi:hypothetical protein